MLIMLSVLPVAARSPKAPTTASGRLNMIIKRVDEALEQRHHQHVHQQHAEAQRGEDLAEGLDLVLGLAALA